MVPLRTEQRPWGSFRVFYENADLSRSQISDFLLRVKIQYGFPRHYNFMSAINSLERNWSTTFPDKPLTIKIINIKPYSRLSYQYHNNRSEHWTVLEGTINTYSDSNIFQLIKADSCSVPPKTPHRLAALAKNATVLEIATGPFSESDIVRLEDDYSRVPVADLRKS